MLNGIGRDPFRGIILPWNRSLEESILDVEESVMFMHDIWMTGVENTTTVELIALPAPLPALLPAPPPPCWCTIQYIEIVRGPGMYRKGEIRDYTQFL
jgi:hypothetical protein